VVGAQKMGEIKMPLTQKNNEKKHTKHNVWGLEEGQNLSTPRELSLSRQGSQGI